MTREHKFVLDDAVLLGLNQMSWQRIEPPAIPLRPR